MTEPCPLLFCEKAAAYRYKYLCLVSEYCNNPVSFCHSYVVSILPQPCPADSGLDDTGLWNDHGYSAVTLGFIRLFLSQVHVC